MSTKAPDFHPPERSIILSCLARIRWRLWTVRLVERLTIALQWGAAVGLFLTASRLLRNTIPALETRPYTAAFIAIIPLLASIWLFHSARRLRLPSLGLNPLLLQITAVLTALLSAAMAILTFLPAGALIPVWAVPTASVAVFLLLAAATVRVIDYRRAAIFVDRQVGLHERVSTALELLEAPASSGLEAAFHAPVIASALAACQEVRSASVGYRRLDSRLYASAALIAIAAAGVSLLTPIPARAINIRKPVAIQITKAKDLQAVFKELEEKKLPNDKVTPEKLKPLQSAINQLQQGTMSPIESSAMLSEAKEQMKRDQEAMAASDKVQEMLKAMSQTKDLAQAADDLKKAEVQKAQGDGGGTAAANQKSADDALKAAADTLANKMKSGQMSQNDKDKLAQDLKSAADKASSDPQLQKDLQDAANAAQNGDSQQLSQSLQDAGQRMGQQSANSQMSQSALNRAMSEIDRMQNQAGGGAGSQSTMGQPDGNQGNQGDQGDQANNGGQNGQNGQNGKDGQGQGQPGDSQAGGQQGGQQGNGPGGDGQTGGPWNQTNGTGSTMLEAHGGPGGHQEGPINGKASFVRIYDPRQTGTKGDQQKIGSFINPLGAATGSVDVMGQADKNDPSIKTYSDVLPEARQQAMDELTRQEYPPQYQEMVRRFYEK